MRVIAAIALLTFRSITRSRALAASATTIAVLILSLPLVIKGDGTPGSQLGIFINYSFGLLMFFSSLAATWTGAGALSLEIGSRQIQLLITKPVKAIQLWSGKWLGIMAFNTILLALGGFLICAMTLFSSLSRGEMSEIKQDAGRDMMTVYRTIEPLRPDKTESAPAAVGPGQSFCWQFVLPVGTASPGHALLKYKFIPSPFSYQSPVKGAWRITPEGQPQLPTIEQPASPNMVSYLHLPSKNNVKTALHLRIEYQNNQTDPPVTVFFHTEGEPNILYPISSFKANLLRGLLMLLARLAFFTSLGMIAGTLFSFPVALFVSMGMLATAFSGDFVNQIAARGLLSAVAGKKLTFFANILDESIRTVFRFFDYIFSPLERFNPLDYLPDGLFISWDLTLQSIFILLCVYPLFLMAVGAVCLQRREVGLVSE